MENIIFILAILACVCSAIIGILFVLAPIFIWVHVARLRKELHDEMTELRNDMSAQMKELRAVNANFMAMQQRYIKTMQYVCDRIADICDHLGAEEHNSVETTDQ